MLAIGYEDGSIQIWDAQSLSTLADFAGHSDLTGMAFNSTSDQLVTSSMDGSIRIWDLSPLSNP
jgi:WD40 repeat protein